MLLMRILLLALVLLLANLLKAQLCQGSLGDPIVKTTFGAGANPGPSLSAASTTYKYSSTPCPSDGFYILRNSSQGCNLWHNLATDHTGDPNGYFMLVNASYQPSAFYIDTVELFCSNTTYEFAAWVINMNTPAECGGNAIKPNLTFNIETTGGTVLQTYNTGNIPPPASVIWKQYGFYFTIPANVHKIVLRITNNAPGGCGNDLALDDITFRPCGPLINSTIDGNGGLKSFCQGTSEQVTFSGSLSTPYSNPYYQWQVSTTNGNTWTDIPGAHSGTLTQSYPSSTAPGTYLYRFSVSQPENKDIAACRVNSNPLTVKINSTPSLTIQNNNPVCEGQTVQVIASGGEQYLWKGVNGFTSTAAGFNLQNSHPMQSGTYSVIAANSTGCTKTDSTNVAIYPKPIASVNVSAVDICEGDSVHLFSAGGGDYQWMPHVNLSAATIADPFAFPRNTTQYNLVVTNSFGCRDSAQVIINVYNKPIVNAGADKTIIAGQEVQLTGFMSGSNATFQWGPAAFIKDNTTLQPLVNPPASQQYWLTVTSNAGCGTAIDSVMVKVYQGVFVPNAFTPNGDGKNDRWVIPALEAFSDYEIFVFNRYGQVIYHTKDTTQGWDGKWNGQLLPGGVYPYIIKMHKGAGMIKGWITIIL